MSQRCTSPSCVAITTASLVPQIIGPLSMQILVEAVVVEEGRPRRDATSPRFEATATIIGFEMDVDYSFNSSDSSLNAEVLGYDVQRVRV